MDFEQKAREWCGRHFSGEWNERTEEERDDMIAAYRSAFEAGAEQMKEEAAKVCDRDALELMDSEDQELAADCAAAIRALPLSGMAMMTKLEPAQQLVQRISGHCRIATGERGPFDDPGKVAALIESDRAATVEKAMVDLREWLVTAELEAAEAASDSLDSDDKLIWLTRRAQLGAVIRKLDALAKVRK